MTPQAPPPAARAERSASVSTTFYGLARDHERARVAAEAPDAAPAVDLARRAAAVPYDRPFDPDGSAGDRLELEVYDEADDRRVALLPRVDEAHERVEQVEAQAAAVGGPPVDPGTGVEARLLGGLALAGASTVVGAPWVTGWVGAPWVGAPLTLALALPVAYGFVTSMFERALDEHDEEPVEVKGWAGLTMLLATGVYVAGAAAGDGPGPVLALLPALVTSSVGLGLVLHSRALHRRRRRYEAALRAWRPHAEAVAAAHRAAQARAARLAEIEDRQARFRGLVVDRDAETAARADHVASASAAAEEGRAEGVAEARAFLAAASLERPLSGDQLLATRRARPTLEVR